MRTLHTASLLALLVIASGCAESPDPPTAAAIQADVPVAFAHGGGHDARFRAHLTGDAEVPPNDSRATGQAMFTFSADGTTLDYRLVVANIQDVTMAHIHMAPVGENGPVVAWLYPDAPPPQLIPGRTQGILATGTIDDADLMGPLAGMTVAELMAAIAAGDAYVNVHTNALPGGEVRGQIR